MREWESPRWLAKHRSRAQEYQPYQDNLGDDKPFAASPFPPGLVIDTSQA
jgi:hypothetical protein